MSNPFEMLAFELKSVKKAKININEALKQLESIQQVLQHVNNLDKTIINLSHTSEQLKEQYKNCITKKQLTEILNQQRIEQDFKTSTLHSDLQLKVESQLDDAISKSELQYELKQKASLNQLDQIQSNVTNMSSQLDSFLYSHWASFKTDTKLKFAKKADQKDLKKMNERLDNLEGLWNLQQRVEKLEETIKELTAVQSESDQDDEGDIFDQLEKDLFGAVIEGQEQNSQNRKKRTLGEVSRQLNMLESEFKQQVKVNNQVSQKIDDLEDDAQSRIGLLENQLQYLQQNTLNMREGWRKVESDYTWLQDNLQKNEETAKNLFEKVKSMIFEHKKNEKAKVKRMKQIEVNFAKSLGDLSYVRQNLKDKVNECIKSIHTLSENHNQAVLQINQLNQVITSIHNGTKQNLDILKADLDETKGPLNKLLNHKFMENEILTEDLKRQQDVMRELIEEFAFLLEQTKPNLSLSNRPPSYQEQCSKALQLIQLKQENVRLKNGSASPSTTLRPKTASSINWKDLNYSQDHQATRHKQFRTSIKPTSVSSSRATARVLSIRSNRGSVNF